MNYDAQYSLVA